MNIFQNKTAVIFDFDGTIADTFRLHQQAFHQALESYKLSFDYADYTGRSTAEAIEMIFSSNKTAIDSGELGTLVASKRKLANQLYHQSVAFIPGALDVIELLHKKGIRLFIGSSGSKMNITTGLQALSIAKYFEDVITSDDVSRAKPDPEIFQLVLRRHELDAEEVIVIEDALSGIQAAHRSGLDVVCIDMTIDGSEYNQPFYRLEFKEIFKLLSDE